MHTQLLYYLVTQTEGQTTNEHYPKLLEETDNSVNKTWVSVFMPLNVYTKSNLFGMFWRNIRRVSSSHKTCTHGETKRT